jgi:hypothetical protein
MRAYLLGGRPIHFPFLSGLLTYDCDPCDAPCCKGTALGIGRSKEIVTLQSAQPRIPLFTTPGFAGSSMLSIQAPREACWFLDKKSSCRLHSVVGREAKPAGCRMFPFQRLRSLGEAVAVMPDFSCPLGVAAGPSDDGQTSHDELALEMHRTGVPRGGHMQLPPPRDLSWAEAVPLERRIVEAGEHHLDDDDYLAYATVQAKLTQKLLKHPDKKDRTGHVRSTIERFLQVHERPSADAVRELVALSGTLRLMASSIPRREMPGLLVSLSVMLGIYEGMHGARRSPRTILSIFEQRLPFLYVLSHLGDRPMVREPAQAKKIIASLPAVRAPLLEVLEGMVENRELTVAETLEDILREQGHAFESPLSADAVTMLHGLGRVLLRTGMFVPV